METGHVQYHQHVVGGFLESQKNVFFSTNDTIQMAADKSAVFQTGNGFICFAEEFRNPSRDRKSHRYWLSCRKVRDENIYIALVSGLKPNGLLAEAARDRFKVQCLKCFLQLCQNALYLPAASSLSL